jgi:uncharacterized protein (DUF305 family)
VKRLLFIFAAVALGLAGCGDAAETGAAPPEHNQADIAFLQGMIPHHRQAVEMSDLAQESSDSPEVLALAEQIKAAQQPEIDQMQGLLDEWGVEGGSEHGGAHGGGGGHAGMLSEGEMTALAAAEGGEFDRLFLTGMIAHHEGAITASQTELTEGQSAEAQKLAQEIIDAQEAEIAEMQALLDQLA